GAVVRAYVLRLSLMVAPLNMARGMKNEMLEAMAMGVPVVSIRIAAGGVDAIPEQHVLVAQSNKDYVRQILRVLDAPPERARLARAGRERMLSHHAWPKSMQRLDRIIDRCLTAHAEGALTLEKEPVQ